ncbi:MAG TPA: ribosome maturation factor RimP [Polyangiaceae bacterium]|nr:ribosome maturation factor RimP [Polyangiaceae bacterium]
MQEMSARHRAPSSSKEKGQKVPKVDLAAVRELVEPVVIAHGLELFDVQWQSTHHGQVLRVVIERPMGDEDAVAPVESTGPEGLTPIAGVALEDCVAVSRDLSTVLDVEELVDARYNLEVSSPGLDRPLQSARDFRRQVGRLAKVKLLEPAADGQRVLRGTIVRVDDESFEMNVDGNLHQVRLSNIDGAKLVFELPQQPKKRPSNPRKGGTAKGKKKGRSRRK